jgi:hypothetical protein
LSIPKVYSTPIPQIAWYLQIKDKIPRSKRRIDKMTTAEIGEMYRNKKFLCDTCSKELGKCNFTLEEHILHLINPMVLWTCEDCLMEDMRNDRVIASMSSKLEQWKEKLT